MKNTFKTYVTILLSLIIILNSIRFDAVAVGNIVSRGVGVVTTKIEACRTTMEEGDKQSLRLTASHLGGTMTWSSSSPSVATVDSVGVVSAISPGITTITSRYSYNGAIYTDTITIEVFDKSNVVGIENGRNYYIMNYSGKRLMGLATASDLNLTNVNTGERTENTRYQWVTEQQTDGTFQLISTYSSAGRCLDVTGSNVDIYADSGASYQKFTIERVTSEPYEGLYLIKHGEKFVAQESDYDVRLTETKTASCYWSFMAVPKQYAEFFCHEYPIGNDLFQTNLNYTYFRNVFNSLNYATSWSYTNNTATAAYNCMTKRDDVFIFSGHGNAGMIAFYEEENGAGICTGSISSNAWITAGEDNKYISSIEANGLNHARAIIYFGCETGKTFNRNNLSYHNLVDETFEKGAHFVLGVEEVIYANHHNEWLEYFLDAINSGMNIVESVEYAKNTLGPITVEGVNYAKIPLYTRGDDSQYLAIT